MATSTAKRLPKLLQLPLELRLNIYGQYFWSHCHPSAQTVHEEYISNRCWCEQCRRQKQALPVTCDWQPPLLVANKQIYDEVMDFLRRQKTMTYRVTWQESAFDDLASWSANARKETLVGTWIEHIRVEIYSPHRDRPTDFLHIWREILGVYSMLREKKYWTPQHLSVIFMENEVASWSEDGDAREHLYLWGQKDGGIYYLDIDYIF